MKDARGFALLAVLLVLALTGVVTGELALSMRLEASMVRAEKESIAATHLAEAGVHQAAREILSGATIQALDEDGQLVFYRTAVGQTTPARVPPLARLRVPLGAGHFSYRITDEESRLNVNLAPPDRVARLLEALGLDRQERDTISDSLEDWKDPNDEYRINGAESDDYYLKLPVPYRARNRPLLDVRELLQIRGVSREIYYGTGDRPGLGDLVTTSTRNAINVNTAHPLVLKALALSDAEITDIVQTRTRSPYSVVPGRFGARGLIVGAQVFRIEAEGLVAGVPRARVVAIVQRGGTTARAPVAPGLPRPPDRGYTVLSWRVEPGG